ncbi:hypothetical protein GCK72_004221 [Caenorhabditis remanei]|uniref:Uncharacterized protein n=1 Tax=Caenorhabditis remanei TaxID=31234 RepID=A0A6A5HBU4_CAERE|nr:hypothetical protein GCK72_004221 [Caenorhabditis remanei]KAF1764274.1 hypothetical protein GCK72_004221 [Caenorhabditis remanei]
MKFFWILLLLTTTVAIHGAKICFNDMDCVYPSLRCHAGQCVSKSGFFGGNDGSDGVECNPECPPMQACYWGRCVIAND